MAAAPPSPAPGPSCPAPCPERRRPGRVRAGLCRGGVPGSGGRGSRLSRRSVAEELLFGSEGNVRKLPGRAEINASLPAGREARSGARAGGAAPAGKAAATATATAALGPAPGSAAGGCASAPGPAPEPRPSLSAPLRPALPAAAAPPSPCGHGGGRRVALRGRVRAAARVPRVRAQLGGVQRPARLHRPHPRPGRENGHLQDPAPQGTARGRAGPSPAAPARSGFGCRSPEAAGPCQGRPGARGSL